MSIADILRPNLQPGMAVRPLLNIGALLDIPTGTYVQGKYGESILNGGLGILTGIVGIGNNFKSTIAHYMVLSGLASVIGMCPSFISTYDTEMNIHESRLRALAQQFFPDKDILTDGTWIVTDTTVYTGNKWYEEFKSYLDKKQTNKKELTVELPFLERDGKTLITTIVPTFGEIDSLTEFSTEAVGKMQQENELGDSGANTMHMRLGADKARMLMEIPTRINQNTHYLVVTAQLGKDVNIASGPFAPQPTKRLTYLQNNDAIKGVGNKFFFALSNLWHARNASPLINQSTKGEEYPLDKDDVKVGSTDLNVVTLRQLRSKSGRTGVVLELLVSQTSGVLPTLSEFHYIKNMDKFGLNGNNITYRLDIYPDLVLSRPTIREKINNDPLLRRAINITSELCQIMQFMTDVDKDLLCTPKELYDDIKSLGYDWNVLLQTRGWWTINNDKHPVPFLSTMDLLRMRKGLYKPYWM
jgi:hypothetical protein